jgi:hypothetical protein
VRFDRVTVVINRWGYGSGVGALLVGVAETTHEVDGLAEEIFRRLRRSRFHQLDFERELLGFGTAFRSEVVFAVEHIQRTGQDIGVIGLTHDALGERALLRRIRRDPSLTFDFVNRQRLRRDSSLTMDSVNRRKLILLVTFAGRRNDGPSRIAAFAEGHGGVGVIAATRGLGIFVCIRHQRRFQLVLPLAVAVGGDVFGADSGDGLQQELGEIAEGDRVFAGDAPLRHEEKGLGEGAVDVGGGGQVGAVLRALEPLRQRLYHLVLVWERDESKTTRVNYGSGVHPKR